MTFVFFSLLIFTTFIFVILIRFNISRFAVVIYLPKMTLASCADDDSSTGAVTVATTLPPVLKAGAGIRRRVKKRGSSGSIASGNGDGAADGVSLHNRRNSAYDKYNTGRSLLMACALLLIVIGVMDIVIDIQNYFTPKKAKTKAHPRTKAFHTPQQEEHQVSRPSSMLLLLLFHPLLVSADAISASVSVSAAAAAAAATVTVTQDIEIDAYGEIRTVRVFACVCVCVCVRRA